MIHIGEGEKVNFPSMDMLEMLDKPELPAPQVSLGLHVRVHLLNFGLGPSRPAPTRALRHQYPRPISDCRT